MDDAFSSYARRKLGRKRFYALMALLRQKERRSLLVEDEVESIRELGRYIPIEGAVMQSNILDYLNALVLEQPRIRAEAREHQRRREEMSREQEEKDRQFRSFQNSQKVKSEGGALGCIYVLSNKSLKGRLKIGKTKRSAAQRAAELSGTGQPNPFKVEFELKTDFPSELERRVHKALSGCREKPDREFFRIPLSGAIAVIEEEYRKLSQ